MQRAKELTFLAFCLCFIAASTLPGCKRKVTPAPEPAVVTPYSVDLAFTRHRQLWAAVALATAEHCEANSVGEVEGNAFAKPRMAEALTQAFGVLADELDARMEHNPATPEEYAAAMREWAYLADPSLKAK